ncbi:hypothetical protein V501_03400 [Pseudogymnoascus sp. VKM F-4519 (FW-2642)]|nr:hypothetical protein V501_03400 [Pseudogymnoascus sp. VKM F-4519 (FW-2642)]
MGFFKKSETSAEAAVGLGLLAVLPNNPKPWYKTPHIVKLNLILLVALFSSATVGFDGAMMNGLQTLEQWRNYFNHPQSALLGTINAVYPIGKILVLFPCTWLSDKYGRKVPMFIGFIFLLVGAALQGAAQNLPMFIISRLILGGATALIAQPSPILITELAYPTQRGQITALYNTFYYLGAIMAAWFTYGTFKIPSTWAWRIPSLLQGALPLIQWLIAKHRHEEARKILVKYHGGGDDSSPLVDYEMNEIEENIRLEANINSQTTYFDLIRTAPNRRRTLIAVITGIGSQWNGVGVVSYYLTLVLNTIGITSVASQALINGLLQVFNWIAAVLAGALMVDRIGRRTLFLTSTTGMLVSYICWTILTSVFARTLNQQAGNAVLAFIFIYYFFYDIAWTPLFQAYPVEIFPYALRGRGLTVALASGYISLIIGQFCNPIAMKSIGWKYYIFFCALLAVLLSLIWLLFPETKGHTLEEIAEIFDGKKDELAHDDDKKEIPIEEESVADKSEGNEPKAR